MLIREISEKVPQLLSEIEIPRNRSANVEMLITNKGHVIYSFNGKPLIIRLENYFIPTIEVANEYGKHFSKVVVDRGAVPHIANGADVMAPGIVRIEGEFRKGDIVLIAEETYGRIIAIGVALLSSSEVGTRGKVIENLHYVGDKLWRFIHEIYG